MLPSCPQEVERVGVQEGALGVRLEQREAAKQEWDQDLDQENEHAEDTCMDAEQV